LTHDWSFFEVPLLSRAGQSLGIYGGKIVNGWPLIVRNVGPLFRRFVFDRFRGTDRARRMRVIKWNRLARRRESDPRGRRPGE
jgi:hypothetical protein